MSTSSKTSTSKKSVSLRLSDLYLIAYNLILTVGWFGILCLTVQTALTWKSSSDLLSAKGLYKSVEFWLQVFQTAALLEVVHAAVGLVRSNPALVFVQVLSRLLVVWLITFLFESSRNSVGCLVICVAWPIAEIVRYVYYALNILDKVPHFIAWCRYTFFIVLYPVGVSGELICIYKAVEFLQPIRNRARYSLFLPNAFNISLDLFFILIITMLTYIPFFPVLYGHMLAQRRKILGGATTADRKSGKKKE